MQYDREPSWQPRASAQERGGGLEGGARMNERSGRKSGKGRKKKARASLVSEKGRGGVCSGSGDCAVNNETDKGKNGDVAKVFWGDEAVAFCCTSSDCEEREGPASKLAGNGLEWVLQNGCVSLEGARVCNQGSGTNCWFRECGRVDVGE